jgi:hypothetical protein
LQRAPADAERLAQFGDGDRLVDVRVHETACALDDPAAPPDGRRPGCFAVAVDHCNDRAEHRFFEQPPRGRE